MNFNGSRLSKLSFVIVFLAALYMIFSVFIPANRVEEIEKQNINIETVDAYQDNVQEYVITTSDGTVYDTGSSLSSVIVKQSSDNDFTLSKITYRMEKKIWPFTLSASNETEMVLEIPEEYYRQHGRINIYKSEKE